MNLLTILKRIFSFSLKQWFSTGGVEGPFTLQRASGTLWRHLWLSELGVGLLWAPPVGRDRDIPAHPEPCTRGPTAETSPAPNVRSAEVRRPAL